LIRIDETSAETTTVQHSRAPFLSAFGRNSVVSGLIAGLLAGLLGASLQGVLRGSVLSNESSGLLVILVATFLGGFLTAWPQMTAGAWAKGAGRFGMGAIAAAVAGILAVAPASSILYATLDNASSSQPPSGVAMGGVWALVAAAVGLAIGALRSPRAALSGLIGGAIGGFVGGLVFAFNAHITVIQNGPLEIDGLNPTTLASVAVTAAIIGVSIGLVDRVTRRAWLSVVEGRLKGREIILDRPTVSIGRSPRCTVVLLGDPGVQAEHLVLELNESGAIVTPSGQVRLNGDVVEGEEQVNPGDILQISGSFLRFDTRHGRR
jgi:MFS family permease